MSGHINEYVTVALPGGTLRGVVYTTDPESGWVSVLVANGDAMRLLVVRPDVVTFTGEICSDPPQMPCSQQPVRTVRAADVADAFRRRNMDARVVGGKVVLLGGAVQVTAPFTERDVQSQNETVLARVVPILREIRGEIE